MTELIDCPIVTLIPKGANRVDVTLNKSIVFLVEESDRGYVCIPVRWVREHLTLAPILYPGFAWEIEKPFTVTLDKTVGIYGHDKDNNPWTTFTFFGKHTATCAYCHATISGGYSRGMLGNEDYFCTKHVRLMSE